MTPGRSGTDLANLRALAASARARLRKGSIHSYILPIGDGSHDVVAEGEGTGVGAPLVLPPTPSPSHHPGAVDEAALAAAKSVIRLMIVR